MPQFVIQLGKLGQKGEFEMSYSSVADVEGIPAAKGRAMESLAQTPEASQFRIFDSSHRQVAAGSAD